MSGCAGMLGFCFTDFNKHKVFDKTGEPKKHSLITSIQDDGIVTTEEKKKHDLEVGDKVEFYEVIGMDGING